MPTFGKLLRSYRLACTDPHTERPLTQARLAELISIETGHELSPGAISEWERDQNFVGKNREKVLPALVKILHALGGLKTLGQANDLLATARYRALNSEEERSVFDNASLGKEATGRKRPPPKAESESQTRETERYIVGRDGEVSQFAAMLAGTQPRWMLNIFGPGGIGKTVVGKKLQNYARSQNIPVALIDGNRPDLTPETILYHIKNNLSRSKLSIFQESFQDFDREWNEHLQVQNLVQRGGGISAIFDVVGSIKSPADFNALITSLGYSPTESFLNKISNRFALERYLRGIEQTLINSLVTGLQASIATTHQPVALIVDTYEEMEAFDDWVCRTLVPQLPPGLSFVVLGRIALPKVNFDWDEHEHNLTVEPLRDLSELEAKDYLRHYDLTDPALSDRVYQFTGGYPLLLVLARQLAQEVGGWEHVGAFESESDKDRIALKLLERILRHAKAREVRAFIEKGVVARWFNPEIVRVILDISPSDSQRIYDQLSVHSFVERHAKGLKFHDKIRELLLARLKFNTPEYNQITARLQAYYAEKAGILMDEPTNTDGTA